MGQKLDLKSKYLFLVLAASYGCSCGQLKTTDAYKPEQITESVHVSYSDGGASTLITFSSTDHPYERLRLPDKNKLLVNGNALRYEGPSVPNCGSGFYTRDEKISVDELAFQWTDQNGKIYANTVALKKAAIPYDFSSLSRSQTSELKWEGPALAKGEVVTLSNSLGENLGISQDEGDSSIKISPTTINSVSDSTLRLHVTRSSHDNLEQGPPAGATISLDYRSNEKDVQLN